MGLPEYLLGGLSGRGVAAVGLWVVALGAQAQMASPEPLQNVAQLQASASVEVQQDLLSMAMNTTVAGTDAGQVQAQLKRALDAALVQARAAAMPGQMEVRTGAFSLYPRYGKEGQINGWQGSAELVLEGRDFSRITATASSIRTLTVGQVGFALSREQRARVEREAQAQAIERFRAKAGEVARGFGFGGYSLREVAVNANDQESSPRPRMAAMQARAGAEDAPLPVEAGKSLVQVNVSGSVQMK